MKVYNLDSRFQLFQAMAKINRDIYQDNIEFNREPEAISSNCFRFTLKVKDSAGKGARRGYTGRRMISACWHAHGDFFDALFSLCPQARIISAGQEITADHGNWIDKNIGSIIDPLMYSDACNCNKDSL